MRQTGFEQYQVSHESTNLPGQYGAGEYGDSMSRDSLVWVPQARPIQIEYIGEVDCCHATAWGGFSIVGTMDPLVVFSAANSFTNTNGNIIFNNLLACSSKVPPYFNPNAIKADFK